MNRKQLAILLVLVIVLGGAGLLLRKKQAASWEGSNPSVGQKLLGNFPVNDITRINIKQGTNELNLVKQDDLWRVGERSGYPANYSEISDFLIKARDLRIVQSEKLGPSQWPRLALIAGQGTNAALEVNFLGQNDKSIKTLLLGKMHTKKSNRQSPYGDMGGGDWSDGRFVRVGADSDNVVLISETFANIEPRPDLWLDRDFFKVEKVRSVAIAFPAVTNSWTLTRDTATAEWKLADAKPGEQLDSARTVGVSNPLSALSFADVAVSASLEMFGLDKPIVAKLETFDNFTYTVKVGRKTNDNYPLTYTVTAQFPKERTPGKDEKPEDKARLDKEFQETQKKLEEKLAQEKTGEKWIYLVSTWTLDPLLKERSQLFVEKKEEPKKDDKPVSTGPATPEGESTNTPLAEADAA